MVDVLSSPFTVGEADGRRNKLFVPDQLLPFHVLRKP